MNSAKLTEILPEKEKKTYFKGTDPQTVSFEYLVQLWNVIRTVSTPNTPMQFRCEEASEQYSALQGITPEAAKLKFTIAAKNYLKANSDRDIIESSRRKGPLVVTNNSLKTVDKQLVVKEGYIEEYSAKNASIRQVADIIAMYTTYNQKSKMITTVFTHEACKLAQVPYLDLVSLRYALGVEDLDALEARAKIMFKLQNSAEYPFYWFHCLQVILHHDSMERYRIEAGAPLVAWYNKQTILQQTYRRDKYYVFNSSKICLYNMSLDHTWLYALRSDALRGITKKRGIFTVGYYSYPLASHYIRWISEAKDILSVVKKRDIQAIEFLTAERMLIELLVYNGLCILCRALSTEHAIYDKKGKIKPGVYGSFPDGYNVSLYRCAPMKPVIDGKSIKFDKIVPMQDGEIRSMYLSAMIPMCSLYPSTRVADGIVMTYYSSFEHSKPSNDALSTMRIQITELGNRFCKSVTWRNVFVFTRVPYYLRDRYVDFFVDEIHYPRLKEEKDMSMFDNKEEADAKLQMRPVTDEELGDVVRMRVDKVKYEEHDVVITQEMIDMLLERSRSNCLETLHHKVYQALSSPRADPAMLVLCQRNTNTFWKVLKFIEGKLIDNYSPTLKLVQFDYLKWVNGAIDYTSDDHVPYESEPESREESDGEEDNDDGDQEPGDEDVEKPPDEEENEDIFKNVVTVEGAAINNTDNNNAG